MKQVKKSSLGKIGAEVRKYFVLRKRLFYFLAIFILAGVVILFGTKIYLAINLLIGDDSLVRLTASEREVFLLNLESSEVEFNTYVSTNPFCKSVCEYEMMDLSTGRVIERDSFYTRISNPNSRSYVLQAPERGEGQKLYRFSVSCLSRESGFCKSTGRTIDKSFLFALNYNLNDEQFFLRERAVERLDDFIFNYNKLEDLSSENLYLYGVLSGKVLGVGTFENNLSEVKFQMNEILRDFRDYNYDLVLSKNINFSNKSLVFENVGLKGEVEKYNNFVLAVREMENRLNGFNFVENMSGEDFDRIVDFIVDYNDFVEGLNESFYLDEKMVGVGVLNVRLNEIVSNIDSSAENNFVFEGIVSSELEFILLNFSSSSVPVFSVLPEFPVCSYMGVFETCCDEECLDESTKYPVILLHGHSFNSGISAEKSLGDLKGIQEKLFLDGFLDGGDFILRGKGDSETFKRTQKQLVFSASYYFDIYQNTEKSVILETKSNNLDSYALRLDEIINEVKLETGKDKVIIVAHSMGGLVARKYLQVFGEEDVSKLIMIGTPNHGIDGRVLSTCSVLGADKHCEDMDSGSLFLNKLNYGAAPKIPVENIIGVGCNMQGENGDGVVKNSSAYLSWADNYYVSGTCESFEYLHNKMVRPDEVGEVYGLVKGFLG